MTNFGMLYGFELRKLLGRKIVKVSTIIMVLVILVTLGAPYLFHFEEVGGVRVHSFQINIDYQMQLDGRAVDQELLEEMQEAYGKVPLEVELYSETEEYQTYARPYSAIFHFARQMMGMSTAEARQWQADEQEMYARRQLMLEEIWESYQLTQAEKEFWQGWEAKLDKPVEFRYKEGYVQLFEIAYTIGIITLLGVTICLAGLFTEEHTRKTDQLILSSKYGRKTIYWAKFWAGVTFAFGLPAFFTLVAVIETAILYGLGGFTAAFQLMHVQYSYPLSVGEAILIVYGMIIVAGIITGIFVMILSELIHSNIGTLSIVVGMIIGSMFFNIPDQYRVLSQLWSYLPSEYVAVWSIFNPQTVPVLGAYLTSWQAVPILYTCVGILFAFVGKKAYIRYQVSGR